MNYKFSSSSQEKLDTCCQEIKDIMNEAIKYYDFTILCGNRGEEEQNRAYNLGLSEKRYPYSKHNSMPSMAIDVAPYPISWKPEMYNRFYYLAGLLNGIAEMKGFSVRWGGDFNSDNDFKNDGFQDLPHIEIIKKEKL